LYFKALYDFLRSCSNFNIDTENIKRLTTNGMEFFYRVCSVNLLQQGRNTVPVIEIFKKILFSANPRPPEVETHGRQAKRKRSHSHAKRWNEKAINFESSILKWGLYYSSIPNEIIHLKRHHKNCIRNFRP